MTQLVERGQYGFLQYMVVRKADGRLFVSVDPSDWGGVLMSWGFDMHLLDDIGAQTPEEAIAKWLESIPGTTVSFGIYAGIVYMAIQAADRGYVFVPRSIVPDLKGMGADMNLLRWDGEKDPDEAMEVMFESIKESKKE